MSEILIDSISDVEAIAFFDPVAESNHRIANNLAIIAGLIRSELLTLTADIPPNAGYVRSLLQQMSLRIDASGRLHRLLTDTEHGRTVEACSYLREITEAAARSLTNPEHTKIVFMPECESVISAKRAAAIGMFVGEALVNSLKHARRLDDSGTIWVACKRTGAGGLVIEIVDNGAELPTGFASTETGTAGTGMRLMLSIARDLDSKLEFSQGNLGQVVRLELPNRQNDNHQGSAEYFHKRASRHLTDK